MTEEQYGEMIHQYERLVYTICYQFTHNHHTAQDLSQDAFLSAYAHKNTCPPGAEKPWLARIATNKAKDFLKSAYNRKVLAADDDSMPDNAQALFVKKEEPESMFLEEEAVKRVEAEIHAMKDPYRTVAVMYFLEEKSVEEIAKALSRPKKTVNTQLYRAKKALREKLKEPDDTEQRKIKEGVMSDENI